jgi:outer membrane lipoprotein-sorting protein
MTDRNHRPGPDPLAAATAALQSAPTPPVPDDLAAAATAALVNRLPAPAQNVRRKRFMRYARYGAATAAAAAVAVTAAVIWPSGSSAAMLHAALQKARQAESVRYTQTLAVEGIPDNVELARLRGHQFRIEAADGSQVRVADLKARQAVILDTDRRLAQQIDLPAGPDGQPSLLDSLNKLAGRPGEKAGEEDAGGVRTVKYKVTVDAPKGAPRDWSVWVDPKTGWPVKLRAAGKVAVPQADGKEKEVPYTLTLDRFEWNAAFDEKLFSLATPEGYRAIKGIAPPTPPAGPGQPVAAFLGAVLDKAAKAKSVKVIAKLMTQDKLTHVATYYRQGDVIRMETVWMPPEVPAKPVVVADLKTRKMITLVPESKTAQRGTLGAQESQALTAMMGNFAGMKAGLTGGDDKAVKAVGEERVGGRRTTVYELTVKVPLPGVWKVWVDPETELPVRFTDAEGTRRITLTFEDWNKEFDPKLFSLDVPEGYKLNDSPTPPAEQPVALLRQAAEKAAKAKSYRYVQIRIPQEDTAALPRRVTNLYRGPLQRQEGQDTAQPQIIIADWANKRVLQLDTAVKTASWIPVTDAEAAETRRQIADLPRLVTDQFKGDPDYDLKERPRELVNGRPTRVIEARRKPGAKPAGPNESVVELSVVWVDAETGLPARFRMRSQEPAGPMETIGLFDKWNEEFDPALFKPDVPAGYKVVADTPAAPPEPPLALFRRAADKAAKATSYRAVIRHGGQTETVYVGKDAVRAEMPAAHVIVVLDLARGIEFQLNSSDKTALRTKLSADEVKAHREEMASPTRLLAHFRGQEGVTVRERARETIAGREVRVYDLKRPGEAGKPARGAVLWVDGATELPVRLQVLGADGKPEVTAEFDRWNEEFDPKLFNTDVPAGYMLATPVEKK